MEGIRREVKDMRQRAENQHRRLALLEAQCCPTHAVAQLRKCYNCYLRGHVRRECPALRAQHNNTGHEMRWKQSFHSLSALLHRRNSGNVSKAAILQQASEYIRSLEQEMKPHFIFCYIEFYIGIMVQCLGGGFCVRGGSAKFLFRSFIRGHLVT